MSIHKNSGSHRGVQVGGPWDRIPVPPRPLPHHPAPAPPIPGYNRPAEECESLAHIASQILAAPADSTFPSDTMQAISRALDECAANPGFDATKSYQYRLLATRLRDLAEGRRTPSLRGWGWTPPSIASSSYKLSRRF